MERRGNGGAKEGGAKEGGAKENEVENKAKENEVENEVREDTVAHQPKKSTKANAQKPKLTSTNSSETSTKDKKKTVSEKSSSTKLAPEKKESLQKKADPLLPQSSLPHVGGTMLSEVMNYGSYSLAIGHKARNVDVLVAGRSARSIKVVLCFLFNV